MKPASSDETPHVEGNTPRSSPNTSNLRAEAPPFVPATAASKEVNTSKGSIMSKSNCGDNVPTLSDDQDEDDENEHSFGSFVCLYTRGRTLLGKGGNATIYKGKRNYDNLDVALKDIAKISKIDLYGKYGKEFCREFENHFLASRDNPGVVEVYDWFHAHTGVILVMELVENGVDLYEFMGEVEIKEEDIKYIFLQILNAIEICHNNEIFHMDIKPENVMINTKTLEAKLIDFGGSLTASDEMQTRIRGTPIFHPPEWFTAHRFKAKSLDYWGLGVVLFELTNGRLLFESEEEVINCHSTLDNKFTDNSSFSICQFIKAILHPNEDERLSSKEMVEHEWITESMDSPRICEQVSIINKRKLRS